MSSRKRMWLFVFASFVLFSVFGCVCLKYRSTVKRNGTVTLSTKMDLSHVVAITSSTPKYDDNGFHFVVNESAARSTCLKLENAYHDICGFYKSYDAAHPNANLKCEIKHVSLPIKHSFWNSISCPVLIVDSTTTPGNQWPDHFYNFSKTVKGDLITYKIEYSRLPLLPFINRTSYQKAYVSKNYSSLFVQWANSTVSYDPMIGADLKNSRLMPINLTVDMPGKIVNVSPSCAATMINDHEVIFSLSAMWTAKCKDELWHLINVSRDNITGDNVSYYRIRDVPLVVVSRETKEQAIQAEREQNKHHLFCASVLILLGTLALVWVGRGVN